MKTSDFDFSLPPDLIAQHPPDRREQSRLLVVDRETGELGHRRFEEVVHLIRSDDVLVVNETKVFPARLRGTRESGGGAEILLLHPTEAGDWTALVRPGSKLRAGKRVRIADELEIEILEVLASGDRVVRLHTDLPVEEALDRFGEVPLPPYVDRAATERDRERYQTVYARERGSVAAPTAGLHFTPELLSAIAAKGVVVARLTLHVGVGTFRPVEADDPDEHAMHNEWYRVPPDSADAINAARAAGGAIWTVGTTTVRTLESVANSDGLVQSGEGWTDIFIRPPHRFRAVDRMITNFHLPRSTLLMLVAAFGGYDLVMRSYREAIAAGYRFYSYGDAMAIL